MNQYRLKITWSNGDTQYAKYDQDMWNNIPDLIQYSSDMIMIDGKYIFLNGVRCIEIEEVITERDVKL
jgi:hypothetical protein